MRHYRIVLDTNVLISALGWEGVPAQILESVIKGSSILVISPALIDELKNTLTRQKFSFIPEPKKELFFSLLAEIAEVVSPQIKLDVITADPSDNRLLECALSAQADFIISGDKHLLKLKKFGEIKIVAPARFPLT